MTPTELEKLCEIAAEAGGLVRLLYEQPFEVEYKAPRDPVTNADRAANQLICSRLAQEFPGLPVVAEESPPEDFADFRDHERVFFVDPVDGTREFVDRNGEFAVMIGVVEGEDPVAGVLFAPATGVSWAGLVGYGAFRVDAVGVRSALRVSMTQRLTDASVVASRSHRTQVLDRLLKRLSAREIHTLGSAGLKGARVAEGRADVYLAPGYAGQRWDVCPTEALVTAAGGRVTDALGKKIDYRASSLANESGMLVTNGLLHHAVLEALAEKSGE